MDSDDFLTPAGYEALVQRFNLQLVPHYRSSWISSRMRQSVSMEGGREKHVFPCRYMPSRANTVFGQLEFAFKYDGVNLTILAALFQLIPQEEVRAFVASQPTGKFARRLWYLYEMLTGRTLDLPDAKGGSYVKLLDPRQVFTGKQVRSKRHYVDDNMLGNAYFCPTVRRSKRLEALCKRGIGKELSSMVARFDQQRTRRATRFLYQREASCSSRIGREPSTPDRELRFAEMLRGAERLPALDAEALFELHAVLADERFAERKWRQGSGIVGEELGFQRQAVSYVPPRAADLDVLMQGFFGCVRRLLKSDVDPVVAASLASAGFVMLRPFEDGNGRLSRFVLQHMLSRLDFLPSGTALPLSSTLLSDARSYYETLEVYTRPILELVCADRSDREHAQQTARNYALHYRYLDLTPLVEYLFSAVEQCVSTELPAELQFVENFDRARLAVREIVDLPDRALDLLVGSVSQNQGELPDRERDLHFSMLTDEEVRLAEETIQVMFGHHAPEPAGV